MEEKVVLPLDDSGFCIFHSDSIEWKQQNNFSEYLDKLFDIINRFDKGEFKSQSGILNFDIQGVKWIGKTLETDEPTISIRQLRFDNHICLKMAEGLFYDKLIIDDIDTPKTSWYFNGSEFKKSFYLSTFCISNINLVGCYLYGGIIVEAKEGCENAIVTFAEFSNMKLYENFEIFATKFQGEVFFDNAVFDTQSTIFLTNLCFEDKVNFEYCVFDEMLYIASCEFHGEVIFNNAIFNNETRIEVNKFKGVVSFKYADTSSKMFNNTMHIDVQEEDLDGVIIFENVDISPIKEKDNLLKLQKSDKVKIGKGCIKYRVQSPIFKINTDKNNYGLVVELANSFVNYFNANGWNLGVDIVNRTRYYIELFYYTDEDITIEDFELQLKRKTKDFLTTSINSIDKNDMAEKNISIIDSIISKDSAMLKMAFRKMAGLLTEDKISRISKVLPYIDEEGKKIITIKISNNYNMITNNITNSGTIGVLNTGNVNKIENSISQLQQSGANDIAESIEKIKNAVLLSEELNEQIKEEVFVRLIEISEQANLPKEKRKGKSILKDIFNGISATLNTVGDLATIWGTWGANISKHLNL
ncbi:MAG: hypothetical protein FWD02_04490 [Bacteroidales bacterium]|nr:hypothetical protein [Bacteroidales bacterium]